MRSSLFSTSPPVSKAAKSHGIPKFTPNADGIAPVDVAECTVCVGKGQGIAANGLSLLKKSPMDEHILQSRGYVRSCVPRRK